MSLSTRLSTLKDIEIFEKSRVVTNLKTSMEKTDQRWRIKALGLALAVVCPFASAQFTPDAGSILRQTERELTQKPSVSKTPKLESPSPKTSQQAETTLTVSSFRFAGNKTLSQEQLSSVVQSYLNRPLGFADLQQAADAVTAAYREAGWVVRAYLPKQNINQGVVTIQVIEAVYGKSFLLGDSPLRVATQRLMDMMALAQKPGQAMSAKSVDRALLLMDDLPGVNVTGSMVEGEQNRK